MNLFDILGPVMVGPSSSHTAGAVRIGWMTQKLLGEQPVEAKILMYGSFAATGRAMERTAVSSRVFSACGRMTSGFRTALKLPGR